MAEYAPVLELLRSWPKVTQVEAARRLNEMGLKTREGHSWTCVQVRRVTKYL